MVLFKKKSPASSSKQMISRLYMNRETFFGLAILISALLLFTGCSKTNHSPESASDKVSVTTEPQQSKKLGVISENYFNNKELQSQLHPVVVVSKNGKGYAYIEPVGDLFRVVANGRSGKLYKQVGDITINPDGSKVAYSASENDDFRKVVENNLEGPTFMDIGMPEFTPDGKHLVYTITQKEETYVVVDHKVHYQYPMAQGPLVTSDSRQIVFSTKPAQDGTQQFIISDLTLQNRQVFNSCGETFAASEDTSQIAVVCREGDERMVKIIDSKSRSVISTGKKHVGGKIARLAFAPDKGSVAYTFLVDDNNRYLVYNGKEVKLPVGDEFMSYPIVFAKGEGVGIIAGMAVRFGFLNAFADKIKYEKSYGYISDFIASRDGRHHAYLAIQVGGEDLQRLVVDGNEGPKFDRIVSPQFSPDGRLVAYRARQDGTRFLVISDLMGNVVSKHKNYDMVFQPVFSADGKSIGYGVLEGNELWWRVEKL